MKTIILLLAFPVFGYSQIDYNQCIVIQIDAIDTTKKDTTLIQLFNSSGNLIYEKYKNHRIGLNSRKVDGEHFYSYSDQFLNEEIFVHKSSIPAEVSFDTTKTEYHYENNLKSKEITYTFQTRPKEDRTSDRIIYPQDIRPKQWYLIGEKFFKYDNNDRLIEEYAPIIFYSSQNRYVYEYYDNGKLFRKYSYRDDRLIWTEEYIYVTDQEIMTRTWESDGEGKEWDYPIFKFIHYFDSSGRICKKECYCDKLDKTNVLLDSEVFEYDNQGKMIKHIMYNERMEPVFIETYWYE